MKGGIALRKPIATVRLDTSSSNVTTAAWQTLLAAAANLFGASGLDLFNPSGTTLLIALGAAASEQAMTLSIPPGGTGGIIPIEIKGGIRISLKAADTNMTSGLIVANFYA